MGIEGDMMGGCVSGITYWYYISDLYYCIWYNQTWAWLPTCLPFRYRNSSELASYNGNCEFDKW